MARETAAAAPPAADGVLPLLSLAAVDGCVQLIVRDMCLCRVYAAVVCLAVSGSAGVFASVRVVSVSVSGSCPCRWRRVRTGQKGSPPVERSTIQRHVWTTDFPQGLYVCILPLPRGRDWGIQPARRNVFYVVTLGRIFY